MKIRNNIICIGTVNFGKKYGIYQKKIDNFEIKKIFRFIEKEKINFIDTAVNYGDAQSKIGSFSKTEKKIITKIPKIPKAIINKPKWILSKINKSLSQVKHKKFYAILFHDSSDYLKLENIELKILFRLLKKISDKVGVSVYDKKEFFKVLKHYKPEIIQAPLNIYDTSFAEKKIIDILKKKNIEFHARSIFLQGMLLLDKKKIPNKFKIFSSFIIKWNNFCIKNKVSKINACLSFISKYPHIKKIVIGINSHTQIKEVLSIKLKKIKNFKIKKINNLIDPRQWKKN